MLWRESGTPPVAGGQHDQTPGFLAACRLLWSEIDRWSHAGSE